MWANETRGIDIDNYDQYTPQNDEINIFDNMLMKTRVKKYNLRKRMKRIQLPER
jgi:hypothetical protein